MKGRPARTLLLHLVMIMGALLTLGPLLWMISASFMADGEANSFPPRFVPENPTLAHYRDLFGRMDLARHLFNSIVITVLATLLSVLFNSLAGYGFAKLPLPGREKLFRALSAGLVIPAQVGMLPLFLLLREMGFINTYAGVLVPYAASIYGIFLVRQYTLGLSDDLLDAARVDGAGELRVFAMVALPVIRPILVTLAAFTFLSAWNDFMWPLVILSDSARYTLPVALANLVGEHVQDTELMMAGSVITTLPALLAFLLFQRTYVRGITAGSVKG